MSEYPERQHARQHARQARRATSLLSVEPNCNTTPCNQKVKLVGNN